MVDLSTFVEVTLNEHDDFLKVRETLTRIGVSSRKERVLYQSCHILHKRGQYYIVHFKELFALDGKPSSIIDNDIERRNAIAKLLEDWGLVKIVNPEIILDNVMYSLNGMHKSNFHNDILFNRISCHTIFADTLVL
jgi:hypothetical protein